MMGIEVQPWTMGEGDIVLSQVGGGHGPLHLGELRRTWQGRCRWPMGRLPRDRGLEQMGLFSAKERAKAPLCLDGSVLVPS